MRRVRNDVEYRERISTVIQFRISAEVAHPSGPGKN